MAALPQGVWPAGKCVLGLDCSTQSMKAVVIDATFKIVAEASINFDADLPQYKTDGGVLRGGASFHPYVMCDPSFKDTDPAAQLVVTAPSVMFATALDVVLTKLAKSFDLTQIVAVSASGQQHGSVWWANGARSTLKSLTPAAPLDAQLANAFAVPNGPIWMDSSTAAQCHALEAAVGGPQPLADLCGARAYERFTGNQIAKVISMSKQAVGGGAYAKCERIGLVSSMVVSMLMGDYAPIDVSDGSGMNLLNLKTANWDPQLLVATAGSPQDAELLKKKLGTPVPSFASLGNVCAYFVQKYNFSPACKVIAASGDNPCSLAGLQMRESGEVAVSMGTSDTLFAVVPRVDASPSGSEGVVLMNPVDPTAAMLMLCFKNGSLTRERVRNLVMKKQKVKPTWPGFSTLINKSPAGNGGRFGLFYLESEITPTVHVPSPQQPLIARFQGTKPVKAFADASQEARALIEGQFVAYRYYAKLLGLHAPKRIIATGGGSQNTTFLQILADVFEAPVYTMKVTGSAALGAAYRALHGYVNAKLVCQSKKSCCGCASSAKCDLANFPLKLTFAQTCAHATSGADAGVVCAASPRAETFPAYRKMVEQFAAVQKKALTLRSSL